MIRRFVVQRHDRATDDVHYDLMIEAGEKLATVQLEVAPDGEETRGVRSFDHRRVYLEYEGEVSGGRGVVAIWDQGQVTDIAGDPTQARYEARFAGEKLTGTYELVDLGEDGVVLRRVGE